MHARTHTGPRHGGRGAGWADDAAVPGPGGLHGGWVPARARLRRGRRRPGAAPPWGPPPLAGASAAHGPRHAGKQPAAAAVSELFSERCKKSLNSQPFSWPRPLPCTAWFTEEVW